MLSISRLTWLVVAGLIVHSCGCINKPPREKSVVLYCAADREYAEPIIRAFERANEGTEVASQFDVESSKTLGLVTRIEREKERPRCDVFWNNEVLHTIRLQKQGLLAPSKWPIPDNWPKNMRASDNTWVGISARARVLLVNKEKIPNESDRPTSVLELSDARWKGKCGLAFPKYGTTATHMAVLAGAKLQNGDWKFNTWLAQVKQNAVTLAGNKQVALAVSSGELAWGLTDTDDANIELESGKPVAIIFPDQAAGELGTLLIPNTVAVLKQSPNPVAANLLATHLTSEKVEGRLAMSSSAHIPIWPTSTQKSRLTEDRTIRWAEASFEGAAERWEDTLKLLDEVFGK